MNGGSDRDRLNAYQIKARYLKTSFQLFTLSPIFQRRRKLLLVEGNLQSFRPFCGIFARISRDFSASNAPHAKRSLSGGAALKRERFVVSKSNLNLILIRF